jgi:SPP1 gp7 family putative phage head morphogenesis protein
MEIKKLKLALTAYGDDLQLYANGISEDALTELAQTEEKILALVAELYALYRKKGTVPDEKTVEFVEKLKSRIAELRENVFEEEFEKIKTSLKSMAQVSNSFWYSFFAAAGVNITLLSQKELDTVARFGIYNGNTLGQIFEKLKSRDTDRIFDTLSDAISKGMEIEEAWDLVKKELASTERFTKSEIDAIVNGTANDVSIGIAMKNKLKLRYSAVMDKHVCGDCKEKNGRVFEPDSPELPVLPQHFNCRCQLIPVEEKTSLTAESFKKYIDSMTESEKKKRLGSAKYKGFVSGNYTLKKYEDPAPGQRVELEEILKHQKELLS